MRVYLYIIQSVDTTKDLQGSYKLIRCSRLCEWDLLISTWVVSVFLYEKVANNCYCKKWPPSADWVTWVICDKIRCFLQVHTKWQIYQFGAKTTYKEFKGVKEYYLFHLKEDHLAIKAKKKNKNPHQSNKKLLLSILSVFSGLRSITRLNGRKKSELWFFSFDLICGIKAKKKEKTRSVIIPDTGQKWRRE